MEVKIKIYTHKYCVIKKLFFFTPVIERMGGGIVLLLGEKINPAPLFSMKSFLKM